MAVAEHIENDRCRTSGRGAGKKGHEADGVLGRNCRRNSDGHGPELVAGGRNFKRERDSRFEQTFGFDLVERCPDSGKVQERRRLYGRVGSLCLASGFGQKLFQHN
jgi:hypothetical protein